MPHMPFLKIIFKSKLILLVLATVATTPASADTLVKIERHIPAISSPGFSSPESVDTTLIWVGDGKSRMDSDKNTSALYDAKSDKATMVNRKFSIYYAPGLNPFAPAPGKEDSALGMSAGLSALSPKFVTTVTETDSVAKINGYNCRLWIQRDSMTIIPMVTVSEVWATEDIKFDLGLYRKVYQTLVASPDVESMIAETNKIRGLSMLTSSAPREGLLGNMALMNKFRMSVIAIEEVTVPAGHYDVPKDFQHYPLESEE